MGVKNGLWRIFKNDVRLCSSPCFTDLLLTYYLGKCTASAFKESFIDIVFHFKIVANQAMKNLELGQSVNFGTIKCDEIAICWLRLGLCLDLCFHFEV